MRVPSELPIKRPRRVQLPIKRTSELPREDQLMDQLKNKGRCLVTFQIRYQVRFPLKDQVMYHRRYQLKIKERVLSEIKTE